jgi:hypothetical protein
MEEDHSLQSFLQKVLNCSEACDLDPEVILTLQSWSEDLEQAPAEEEPSDEV